MVCQGTLITGELYPLTNMRLQDCLYNYVTAMQAPMTYAYTHKSGIHCVLQHPHLVSSITVVIAHLSCMHIFSTSYKPAQLHSYKHIALCM